MSGITMKVRSSRVEETFVIDIEGEPVASKSYRARPIVVESASVKFVNGASYMIRVSGRFRLKSGGLGAEVQSMDYFGTSREDLPEWALPMTSYDTVKAMSLRQVAADRLDSGAGR